VFVFQCVPRRTRSNQKRLCLNRDVSHECKAPSQTTEITSRTNHHTWFCNAVQSFSQRSPLINIRSRIIGPVDAVSDVIVQWMVPGTSPCANEAGRELQTFGHFKLGDCSRPGGGDLNALVVRP